MGKFQEMTEGIERFFVGEEKPSEAEKSEPPRQHQGWHEGTIEHPKQPAGGRGLDRYAKVFSLDPETLRNKTILDLGAGPEAKLQKELHERGLSDQVTSLSPDYSVVNTRDRLRKNNQEVSAVAGLGQALPFRDQSFDTVLALHIFEHMGSVNFLTTISETARVLKNGGEAHLGPITYDDGYDPYDHIKNNEKLQAQLREFQVELEFQSIPEETLPPIKTSGGGRAGSTQLILRKA